MHAHIKSNRVDQEPNSIAQEIFDELDETRDGEVCSQGPRATFHPPVVLSLQLSDSEHYETVSVHAR
jgi:hypothetical protein